MNSHLALLGWTERLQHEFESIENSSLVPARVVRANRGQYIVSNGIDTRPGLISGAFQLQSEDAQSFPTVGDWVGIDLQTRKEDAAIIQELLPRKSLIERQAAGNESRHQLIAANVDTLFLVSGLDAEFNINRIQRYLTLVGNSGAQSVILLNKSDVATDLDDAIRSVNAIAPDTPIHPISALSADGLASIQPYLQPGQTVAMLGSSGVGKSTLANALIGGPQLATQSNRDTDSKGRHTTTWRELISLPQGGMLIDLPGMREIQLTGDATGLEQTFSDIEALAKKCRFRNCSHQNEPGCAVIAALETGTLDPNRFNQYQKLKHETESAQTRISERRKRSTAARNPRREKEQRFKEISKRLRKHQNAQSKWRRKNDSY